jgi:hypothetical protein
MTILALNHIDIGSLLLSHSYSIKDRSLDRENAATYYPPDERKIMKDYLSKSHIKFSTPGYTTDYKTNS